MSATSLQLSPASSLPWRTVQGEKRDTELATGRAALREMIAANGCVASITQSVRLSASQAFRPATPPKPPTRMGTAAALRLLRPARERQHHVGIGRIRQPFGQSGGVRGAAENENAHVCLVH